MITVQTKKDLERLIEDKVEENLTLEYKSADALQKTDGKKKEIAKDVSAMANSSGGVIIYGLKEFDNELLKHLPEKITPINRVQFSKETLEQIINNNISPKIEGIVIHPIPLDEPSEVVYVVEIPQGNTAHQNTSDGKYYKRHNFISEWMHDYEIKDIMNRVKHPVIDLVFKIETYTYELGNSIFSPIVPRFSFQQAEPVKQFKTINTLLIRPINNGNVFAQYINYFVEMPEDIVEEEEVKYMTRTQQGNIEFYGENTHRDIVDVKSIIPGNPFYKYGPSRFDPVLPGVRGRSKELKLTENPLLDEREITWTVHGDNASPRKGKIRLKDIPIIEKENSE